MLGVTQEHTQLHSQNVVPLTGVESKTGKFAFHQAKRKVFIKRQARK